LNNHGTHKNSAAFKWPCHVNSAQRSFYVVEVTGFAPVSSSIKCRQVQAQCRWLDRNYIKRHENVTSAVPVSS